MMASNQISLIAPTSAMLPAVVPTGNPKPKKTFPLRIASLRSTPASRLPRPKPFLTANQRRRLSGVHSILDKSKVCSRRRAAVDEPVVFVFAGAASICDGGVASLTASNQELVLCVGWPGCGKSTLAKKYLESKGYVWVNQDTLKTAPKCLKAVREALAAGKSCVVRIGRGYVRRGLLTAHRSTTPIRRPSSAKTTSSRRSRRACRCVASASQRRARWLST